MTVDNTELYFSNQCETKMIKLCTCNHMFLIFFNKVKNLTEIYIMNSTFWN